MTEILVALGGLLAVVVAVFVRGRASGQRAERERTSKVATEAEKRRIEAARQNERDEVEAAKVRREAEQRRPGVDRANERLRRRGFTPAFVAALLTAAPAQAVCREEAGHVTCPSAEFDVLMDELDAVEEQLAVEKARSKRLDTELAAARDRREVACPEPRPPVLEVTVGSSIALVVGLLVGLFVGAAR